MKAKIVLAFAIIVSAPGLAMATCYGGHEDVVMSCPQGQSFDPETKTCITPTG